MIRSKYIACIALMVFIIVTICTVILILSNNICVKSDNSAAYIQQNPTNSANHENFLNVIISGDVDMPQQSLTARIQWLLRMHEIHGNGVDLKFEARIISPDRWPCDKFILHNPDFRALLKYTCGNTRLRYLINGKTVIFYDQW